MAHTVRGAPAGSNFTALEYVLVALMIVVGTALVMVLAADLQATEFMKRCCAAPMRAIY